MTIDLQNPGELWVTMVYWLKGVLEDLPEVVKEGSKSPEAYHMFQVIHEYERMLLNKERETSFHHTMAHLLFFTRRGSKYIKISITLLFNQLRRTDKAYWRNLVRVLRYIIGTLHLPLILMSDSLSVIKYWVDASFAAHPDWKGHTGAMMSMGSG